MSELFDYTASLRDNDLLICVDSYEDRLIAGRLYSKCLGGLSEFNNMMQLILSVQSVIEQLGFPEPYTLTKDFSVGCSDGVFPFVFGEDSIERKGTLATFQIKILFRQNASWQGIVTWIDGRREESFRSALELILLMDSAIS